MTIALLTPGEALRRIETTLQIPSAGAGILTLPLVAQALRRAAHILCPCQPHELANAVVQSLADFADATEPLKTIVDATMEALVAYGELFELRPTDIDTWSDGESVLRPAPPSFVVRSNGSIAILGVAGDDITPLPAPINGRLEYLGTLRFLLPEDGEDLAGELRELGLLELPEKVWLRAPPAQSASQYYGSWCQKLTAKARDPVHIAGLTFLDTAPTARYYPDRWQSTNSKSHGMCVARRPQRYGAPIWCFAELSEGIVQRFIDLSGDGDLLRPCDIAWRIQMAADASASHPQTYRIRVESDMAWLDFFSPLPSWAERRLLLVGEKFPGTGCLFSYRVAHALARAERDFLADTMWLAAQDDGRTS